MYLVDSYFTLTKDELDRMGLDSENRSAGPRRPRAEKEPKKNDNRAQWARIKAEVDELK